MRENEFGVKVRRLREELELSREEFCEDETNLTVRQLMRIESGVSKPTLTKMQFIADRIGIGLSSLMPDFVDLSSEYQNLKYTVLRTPTYGQKEMLEKRDENLNTIYEEYYDELPEEEKLVIDTMRSMTDVYAEQDAVFGKAILDDYLYQVTRKTEYTINDLVILQLYFFTLGNVANVYKFDEQYFDDIVGNLIQLASKFNLDELFVLRDVLLLVANIGRKFNHTSWSIVVFDTLNDMMRRAHDFQKKPIVNMLMWQYYLFVEKDDAKADELYQEAILFSRITNQDYLVEKLNEQWLEDIQER